MTQAILLEDVESLGQRGEPIDVYYTVTVNFRLQ